MTAESLHQIPVFEENAFIQKIQPVFLYVMQLSFAHEKIVGNCVLLEFQAVPNTGYCCGMQYLPQQ
jgi:hypothetical protein